MGLVEIDGVHTASERATRNKHKNQLLNDRFNSSTLRWGQESQDCHMIHLGSSVLGATYSTTHLRMVLNQVLLLLFGPARRARRSDPLGFFYLVWHSFKCRNLLVVLELETVVENESTESLRCVGRDAGEQGGEKYAALTPVRPASCCVAGSSKMKGRGSEMA